MNNSTPILPQKITTPSSYFTDIDPKDQNYNQRDVVRKLKLQLLTKQTIVIAASSLFHGVGFQLFSSDSGLTKCLQDGIILPAIRDEFEGINGFFDAKSLDGYSPDSKCYFTSNTKHHVPWSLSKNTQWFQRVFFDNVMDCNSLFRLKAQISDGAASGVVTSLNDYIESKPEGQRFLTRDDISLVASAKGGTISKYLNSFGHLVYRISGARIVNCEGHFPQSNLTNLGFAGNERQLADTRVFWELYIEAVISHITSAARLSEERIDSLSFEDILKVREGLFDVAFVKTFESIMKLVKEDVDIHDPNKLLMTQDEIYTISTRLATMLRERVGRELDVPNDNSNKLLQLGSVVELFAGGVVFGTVGALKAIPEITSWMSPRLAEAIRSRLKIARRIIESNTGWNPKQKKALISGYTLLLTYGLPRIE